MPNFKVGDWVTTPHRGTFRIEHEMELASWEITLGDQAKLWQPKLHEWCWFLTVNAGYVLGQYVGRSGTNFKYKLNMSDGAIFNCSNYEPFIGTLPTQIKGH